MVCRIHERTASLSRRALVFALRQSMPPSLTLATSRSVCAPPPERRFRRIGAPESPKQTLLGRDQVAQFSSSTVSRLDVLNRRRPSQSLSSASGLGSG